MKEKIKKYLKILYVEIEDLQDDLEQLSQMYSDKEKTGEITPYVFLENLTLIKREIDIVKGVLDQFHGISGNEYATLDDMIIDLDGRIKKKVAETGCAEAVYILLKRKLSKVKNYIDQAGD